MYRFILAAICICFKLIDESESKDNNKVFYHNRRYFTYDNTSPLNSSSSDEYRKWPLRTEEKSCWITMNAKRHINAMEALEAKYSNVRQSWAQALEEDTKKFDEQMLEAMISSRGKLVNSPKDIPAGLNLGGYCMLRMYQSILFFHRMKLRNDTRFRIQSIDTDMSKMRIDARLSLNDLHLVGSYERATTDHSDPSSLYYTPTFGQAEILMKNVVYKMEGRLRLSGDSPFITLTLSNIDFDSALMIYRNNATGAVNPVMLRKYSIGEFLERMKSDLDEWLKDYFNQHLIFFTRPGEATNQEFWNYEMEKTAKLNKYVENSIVFMKAKIHHANATAVRLPSFRVHSVNTVEIALEEGLLRGLESMYRRSVATGGVEGKVRKVDAIVGFSNLKVIYKYTVIVSAGVAPLSGKLVLSADELTAHMGMEIIKDPDVVDLSFDNIQQLKPESLTVEGPGNRMIANFKHILEHHIFSIMSNVLIHNIRQLKSLAKCKPNLFGNPEYEAPEFTLPEELSDDYDPEDANRVENMSPPPADDANPSGDNANPPDDDANQPGDDGNPPGDDANLSGDDANPPEPEPNEAEADNAPLEEQNENTLQDDEAGANSDLLQNEPNPSQENPKKDPDYIVSRVDSIEIELPSNAKAGPGKNVRFNYAEKLNITKLN